MQPRQVFAAQGTVSYESSNSEVATVDSNGDIKVLKAGETTITIRAAETEDYQAAETNYKLIVSHKYANEWKKDNNGYYKECACGGKSYASAVPVLGVTLDKATMSLTAGSTGTLIVTIDPTDAANKSLTWTSDNEAVATVDENGKVTAVAEGTAHITAKTVDGEKTAVCAVTVTAKSSGGSSSGGSSSPSYSVTTPGKTENGTVTVSPKNAKKGTTVTITVTPDKGYTLETLTVLDKDGKEIQLTKKNDIQYTFTMPASKVEVKATFMDDNAMLNYFVDVKANDYFYDAVKWAVGSKVTSGLTETTFGPQETCTRAQTVTFLWRAAGSPQTNSVDNPFTDVKRSDYYYQAVLWAVANNVTNGVSATSFDPNVTVQRDQVVTFLWRASGKPAAKADLAFSDLADGAFYADAVQWAVAHGITTGTSSTTFAPADGCTRAQIVTFLYRSKN